MELDFLDIRQRAPAGRRTLLVIEQDRIIAGDATFDSTGCRINSSHVLDIEKAITRADCREAIEEICGLLKPIGSLPKNLVVSLPPSLFEINLLTLPKTKKANVDRLIRSRFSSVGNVTCKYRILSEYGAGGGEKISVLVFAIPSSIINTAYQVFGRAGFRIRCMSHPLVGVIELLNGSYLNSSNGLTLLVNSEIDPISLSIFNRDRIEHIRFLTNLDRSDHVSFAETLSLEIKRTFLFCKQFYSGATIDNMMYSGPLDSDFFSFAESIYDPVGMPVKVIRISNYESEPGCDLGTWLSYYLPGLCGLQMVKNPFTLLPPERDNFNFSTSHTYLQRIASALLIVVLIVSGLAIRLTGSFGEEKDHLESTLDSVTARLDGLKGVRSSEERVAEMEDYGEKAKAFLRKVGSGEDGITEPLLTILAALPESSEITSVGLSEDTTGADGKKTYTVRIRDNFTGSSSGELEACAGLLRSSRLFRDVKYSVVASSFGGDPSRTREEVVVEICQ